MQYALNVRILLIIIIYTFSSVRVVRADPKDDLPLSNSSLPLAKGESDFSLKATETSLEEGKQIPNESLPLVRVAHKDVMDVLDLLFVPKPIHLPIYTPFLQHFGVRINWLQCLQSCWSREQKSYGGGIDLHFSGPIQLSMELGYVAHEPQNIIYGNTLRYTSKGQYGLGFLSYVMRPNPPTNAYLGIGYGQGRFVFTTLYKGAIPKLCMASWVKLVAGSECRLVPSIYGGMQLGIAYLLHSTKNDDFGVPNYSIPGYGKVVNTVTPDITLYLKWTISFLEKKIAI